MFRCAGVAVLALLSAPLWAAPASAETLRCQSVNGNVNCAGSNGVACQTVNGKKTCVSGNGDVVQSFGKGTSPSTPSTGNRNDDADADDDGLTDAPSSPRTHANKR
jgi:hypothetical protein